MNPITEKPTTIKYIIGIDEVGRGPLAGPVTVCAFAVPKKYLKTIESIGAKDSKKLSEQKRELIAKKLKELQKNRACFFAISSSSAHFIDTQGLSHAIKKIIQESLEKLEQQLNIHPGNMDIYLDGGLRADKRYFRQHTIIGGDGKIPVISCASILAKVHRDHMMDRYDVTYPRYGFLNHKGYGTPEHYANLAKWGPCFIHRNSFLHLKK